MWTNSGGRGENEHSEYVGKFKSYEEEQSGWRVVFCSFIKKDVFWELQTQNFGFVQEERQVVFCIQVCGHEDNKERGGVEHERLLSEDIEHWDGDKIGG